MLATSGFAQKASKRLFIDVHHFSPGSVKAEDVAKAHQKDLDKQKAHGVSFLDYWVDEAGGNVYCLSTAPDSAAIRATHREAHGLLPAETYLVTGGKQAQLKPGNKLYIDIHRLGAGKVKARDVAFAHEKDLAEQGKHDVNFLNYWVDEQTGTVICLSQAPDSASVTRTHQQAHGLPPVTAKQVKGGN
jgi:hypothetical protein